MHGQRGNGLACVGHKGLARLWRLVVSLMMQCPGCEQFGARAATYCISLWHQM